MMKNTPIILTLLCTSLVWCSVPNAMEDDRFVLDTKLGEDGTRKILVLTETGLAKAKALQESYDQQQEKGISPFTESLKQAEYDEGLNHALEESELAEAIRLSLEGQPLKTYLPQDPLETKFQAQPSGLPLPFVKQEDDSEFNKVLLESAREEDDSQLKKAILESTQEHQARIEKLAEERRQAEERRDETIRLLQELRQVHVNNILALYSKIDELSNQEERLLSHNDVFTNEEKEKIKILFIRKRNSVYDEIQTFRPLSNQISDEIQHLLNGGEHRDLPWMQELFLNHNVTASQDSKI